MNIQDTGETGHIHNKGLNEHKDGGEKMRKILRIDLAKQYRYEDVPPCTPTSVEGGLRRR